MENNVLMKASRLHAIGDFRTDEVEIPVPVGEQLLMRVKACGICGSDIPRIFQLGTSKQKYPLTIGHEFAGEIVAVGEKADASLIGARGAVFPLIPCRSCDMCQSAHYAMCEDYDYMGSRRDGGFAEYCLLPSAWHFIKSSKPETSDIMLAMTEPCTVAQHAVRKAAVTAGDFVVVFGAGPIGIMAARWATIFGAAKVLMVDVLDEKVAFAKDHGAAHVINGIKENPAEVVKCLNGGRLADVVIEGTGAGPALEQAISCAKSCGQIVLMGNPHKDTTIKLSAHSNILRKELQLNGIWNSHFGNMPINEWNYTVSMMDSGAMQVEDLVTHTCDLDDLPELCRQIYTREVSICKAVAQCK